MVKDCTAAGAGFDCPALGDLPECWVYDEVEVVPVLDWKRDFEGVGTDF